MKSLKKTTFPELENEFLEDVLRQLVNQYKIVQMFFTKNTHTVFSYLIIHTDQNSNVDQIRQNKWIHKVKKLYKIDVYIVSSVKLNHRCSLGDPFIELYCHQSKMIYQNEEMKDSFVIPRNWKKFKKKFNTYQGSFFHDYDIYKSQIKTLISEGCSNHVFTSYGKLMEYNISYLEELYSGRSLDVINLDERISRLTEYIPEIQKYFVKNSHNKYYLTDLITQAKEATAQDDAIYKSEFYEAISIAEQNLYQLVERRLEELNKRIRKSLSKKNSSLNEIDEKVKCPILEIIIETILKSTDTEQIYLFHENKYDDKTTYYLMLIANGVGNEKLSSINQSLKSKVEGKIEFVLLSHSRYWIQTNLYKYQSFFTRNLQDKFLLYSSDKNHPAFHWEVPHQPYHSDLYFYYRSTKDVAMQFSSIVNNSTTNFQALDSIFALFFLSFCRTYIFVKTYYIPHYLCVKSLWQLSLYADINLRKQEYLIEHFWTSFFPYVDKHMTLHHSPSSLNGEKVLQMNIIVEKLMKELRNLVVESRLLDFEDC